uniref:Uncharacterized protein n=1 Tax=Solanum tuberosum TaxID=4113 RepID=M1BMT1_SOLTU
MPPLTQAQLLQQYPAQYSSSTRDQCIQFSDVNSCSKRQPAVANVTVKYTASYLQRSQRKDTAPSKRKAERCVSLVVFSRVPLKSYIAAAEEQGTHFSPFLFRNRANFRKKVASLKW